MRGRAGAEGAEANAEANAEAQVPTPVYKGVLNNLYRGPRDSISWHSDNEKVLASGIPIASLSVGAERIFEMMKKKPLKKGEKHLKFKLASGSLFIMGGDCQKHFLHCVPKEDKGKKSGAGAAGAEANAEANADAKAPRVNSTFRQYWVLSNASWSV